MSIPRSWRAPTGSPREAPKAAGAQRSIYLCHNYCELGAITFASALGDVKTFLDTNPNEVVILDLQDATSPADTAAAIERAGLGDRVATLRRGEPLPTLGELIRSGRTLLVFAEQGGPGAPAWYQQTYQWFQETPFTFKSLDDFNCMPNRGPVTAPMLLVNHWVSEGGLADPSVASEANSRDVLEKRMQTCLQQRGLLPNIVAVDFAGQGDLVSTARKLNDELLDLLKRVRKTIEQQTASDGAHDHADQRRPRRARRAHLGGGHAAGHRAADQSAHGGRPGRLLCRAGRLPQAPERLGARRRERAPGAGWAGRSGLRRRPRPSRSRLRVLCARATGGARPSRAGRARRRPWRP